MLPAFNYFGVIICATVYIYVLRFEYALRYSWATFNSPLLVFRVYWTLKS